MGAAFEDIRSRVEKLEAARKPEPYDPMTDPMVVRMNTLEERLAGAKLVLFESPEPSTRMTPTRLESKTFAGLWMGISRRRKRDERLRADL